MGPEDEVIVALVCASVSSVAALGANPVFADVIQIAETFVQKQLLH